MHLAAIALGSNLSGSFGPPAANLAEAVRRLGQLGCVAGLSSNHRTAPVGYLAQPDFLNAAALLETNLPPSELLRELLAVEAAMGRDRATAPPKGPRIIDLDLVLYDSLVVKTGALTLPHPAMHARRFVLAPLAEIAPAWPHPILRRTVAQLLNELKDFADS